MKKLSVIDLRSIKAREVMKKDLVTLRMDDPISAAVQVFEEYHISGAPVVDSVGRAVGVLTVADIAQGDHVQSGRIESERYEYYLSDPLEEIRDDLSGDEAIFDKEDYSDELVGEQRVQDWMTSKVISVDPESDLKRICEIMAEESIHRVLVTEEDKVMGIVSTFDIVRFLAENA